MILLYITKSTLCLAVLLLFYKMVLENNSIHQFKRYFLLFAILFSITIPLITFSYETTSVVEETIVVNQTSEEFLFNETAQVVTPTKDYTPLVLGFIYVLGFVFFAVRFTVNLVRLKRKIATANLLPKSAFTLALLETEIVPHSFFKWIFLNEKQYSHGRIPKEVLAHEATHVSQRHSWDILFIELIQVVFWFNPLIWLSKKTIKLNHEFLADQGALKDHQEVSAYQKLLLSYSTCAHHTSLESPFNYSLTKKRIIMLSKSFNRTTATLKALLVIPLVALCVLLFNNEIIAQPINNPESSVSDYQEDYANSFNTGAQKNGKKSLVIEIKNDQIWINGQLTLISQLQSSIDKITKEWTKKEYAEAVRSFIFKGNSVSFMKKAEKEFQKTNYAKANPSAKLLPPPPPPPPAPQTSNAQLPPPPPPPAPSPNKGFNNSTNNIIIIGLTTSDKLYVNGQETTINKVKDFVRTEFIWWVRDVADKPRAIIFHLPKGVSESKAQQVFSELEDFQINKFTLNKNHADLPPPPPPPSHKAHFEKLKKLGGIFYYEGEEISYKRALSLVKTNKNLSIKTQVPYSNPPKTYIERIEK